MARLSLAGTWADVDYVNSGTTTNQQVGFVFCLNKYQVHGSDVVTEVQTIPMSPGSLPERERG